MFGTKLVQIEPETTVSWVQNTKLKAQHSPMGITGPSMKEGKRQDFSDFFCLFYNKAGTM